MRNFEEIVAKLSAFVGITLSKSGWKTVLKGCGLPNSHHLWKHFNEKCLIKNVKGYTLIALNIELAYSCYCIDNQAAVNKSNKKKKAKAKAKAIVLPHLVIDPRSGRIISHMYAIENKYEN